MNLFWSRTKLIELIIETNVTPLINRVSTIMLPVIFYENENYFVKKVQGGDTLKVFMSYL